MSKHFTTAGRWLAIVLSIALLLFAAGCGAEPEQEAAAQSALDPQSPATVTVWNYYNGDQLAAFEQLVEEFNATLGAERGVVVVNVSHGDINTLADSLLSAVKGEAGAPEVPTLAAVYSETAYLLDQAAALEPLDSYFTADELSAYVPGFLEEGRFNADGQLLLFPILKSTELFTANETDWEPFAAATGVTLDSLASKEDLTAAAQAYYEWTDSLTPDVAEDGKALYGRDSMANYVYIGCYQLGHELFKLTDGTVQVELDRDTFKTLWDNYYIPYINGYFGSYAKFRSEDCKTGKILALTGSSSSVSYLPTAVTLDDDSTHDITTYESRDLPFRDAVNDAAVQQGASYCLLSSTPAQQEGAVVFLKWFTEPERNLAFALMSGYSPVTLSANTAEAISAAFTGDSSSPKDQNVLGSLLINAEVFSTITTYAAKPSAGSKEARIIFGDALENIALADREAVLAAMAAGQSRADAVAPYVTDEYFDQWFDGLCEQINAVVTP